ncbi:MAG: protein-glutamate O-methyltransferase CheR [Gammaproteobacteria bacterium]|nr:protein-glutamate O-methyltransferase CheR [Gammaproteobacteria bacterium]
MASPVQNPSVNSDPNSVYSFSDCDFLIIARLIHENTGIYLDHTKRFLVQTRLSRRLKELGLDSFREYRLLLQSGMMDELEYLANAITTNTTSFFRHDSQFMFLERYFLEMQLKKEFPNIRIWSAGCSSGEEPYTIAWVAYSTLEAKNFDKVSILATDLDSEILKVAKKGVYPEECVSKLPPEKVRQAFYRGHGANSGFVKIKPEISSIVTFKKLNLIENWSVERPFDLIFCRNVCIYFHKDTQRALMEKLADMQDEGGYLFLGQSESLFATCNLYKTIENAIYRKIY